MTGGFGLAGEVGDHGVQIEQPVPGEVTGVPGTGPPGSRASPSASSWTSAAT
jgi:hypothetical protein